MPGKGLLKVTGIIMIIFGAIGFIFGLIGFAGIDLAISGYALLGIEVSRGALLASQAVSIIGSLLNLVAGIIGVKFCEQSDKSGLCTILGVALIVLVVISSVLTFTSLGSLAGGLSIFSMILGLVLPVLYVLGASKNKKAV